MGRGSRIQPDINSHKILFQGKFRDYAAEEKQARLEEEKRLKEIFLKEQEKLQKEIENKDFLVQQILDKRIGGNLLDEYKKPIANLKYYGGGTIFYYYDQEKPKPTLQSIRRILKYQGINSSEVRVYPQTEDSLYFFLDRESESAKLLGEENMPSLGKDYDERIFSADTHPPFEAGMRICNMAPTLKKLYEPIKNSNGIYNDMILVPGDLESIELKYI